MREEPVLAIVGATGVNGSEIVSVINELHLPFSEVRLLASERSKGEVYGVLNDEVPVEVLDESSFDDVDIAVFAVNAEVAAEFIPHALQAGAYVVDTSTFSRLSAEVPLVTASLNPAAITRQTRTIASPNACVVELAPVLNAVNEAAGLRRVVATTFHSVSGGGKHALDELWDQTRAVFRQSEIVADVFQHQIAFNCIPQIDVFTGSGYTKEEARIVDEIRKVLGLPELRMTVTAVRVPVFHGNSISVNVETERELQPDALTAKLEKIGGIEVLPSFTDFPMPLTAVGSNEVFVGRIRRDLSVPNGLDMWVVADNIRNGVAFNVSGILQRIIEVA